MSSTIEQLISTANRYDRQQLIEGWDQRVLNNSTLAIIGSDMLANVVALNAASLGFGNIYLYGSGLVSESKYSFSRDIDRSNSNYSKGFLYYDSLDYDPKVKGIADICRAINSDINIIGVNIDLSFYKNWAVVKKPSVIIDATNNSFSKALAENYASSNNIPFVSVSSSKEIGKLGIMRPREVINNNYLANLLFPEISGSQGEVTSLIMSALAVDEARKSLMLLRGEQKLDDILVHNRKSVNKFDLNSDFEIKDENVLYNKHILQIGVGSEGNFTALGFILRDVGKLTLIDDDIAETVNLNRQPFLYGGVGKPKVEAAIDKFRKINPRVEYESIQKRVSLDFESYFKSNKPDLLVDTVDNNKTRALLNYFSLKYNIPFISGGTRHNSGQAIVSVPGVTACLNCKADIDKSALDSYTPQSCILAPTPSVITSNQIIAGLIVDEAEKILAPRIYGAPTNKIIKYVSEESTRLGLLPTIDICHCNTDKKYLTEWVNKMKHLYEAKK
ncbi:MAG: ThiF family adenylyltransferase [Candidatus Woesearchaeota archaeon]